MAKDDATTESGLRVVYAVKFENVDGTAGLTALDQQVAAHCQAIDPMVRVTRGQLGSESSKAYRTAGFLHDGKPRAVDAGPMPELSSEDLAIRKQAEILAELLGGAVTMVYVKDRWHTSVSYTGSDHLDYDLEIRVGWNPNTT
jgi:hypothetical protein